MKNEVIVKIKRTSFTQDSTIGEVYINDKLFALSLELAWKDNNKNISCIPVGEEYTLSKRVTKKRGEHLIVNNTEPRQSILIHPGNTYRDIQGCIILGDSVRFTVLPDNKLEAYIMNTVKTVKEFNSIIFNEISKGNLIKLIIVNE